MHPPCHRWLDIQHCFADGPIIKRQRQHLHKWEPATGSECARMRAASLRLHACAPCQLVSSQMVSPGDLDCRHICLRRRQQGRPVHLKQQQDAKALLLLPQRRYKPYNLVVWDALPLCRLPGVAVSTFCVSCLVNEATLPGRDKTPTSSFMSGKVACAAAAAAVTECRLCCYMRRCPGCCNPLPAGLHTVRTSTAKLKTPRNCRREWWGREWCTFLPFRGCLQGSICPAAGSTL